MRTWLEIVAPWRAVFPQARTYRRAVRHAVGGLVCLGRRCLSRIIWTHGGQHRRWSAEYFLFSRCQWEPQALFAAILARTRPLCRGRLVGVAIDDTRLHKTGRCLPQAAYHRDPLSPPFHVNLIRAVRFLQAAVLVPVSRRAAPYTRAVPIRFEEVSVVKKPRRAADPALWTAYRAARKGHNLSTRFVAMLTALRTALDGAGGRHQTLVAAVDGSFCNRTCLRPIVARTAIIGRTRKDAILCRRAPAGSRRVYSAVTLTPEQIRRDDTIP